MIVERREARGRRSGEGGGGWQEERGEGRGKPERRFRGAKGGGSLRR